MTKKRVYPQGAITSHLIGYTGKLTERDLKRNKNLFNFIYCPVIYRYFPNAKIIHCMRNPLDNILSMYRTNFRNQSFTSSLEDIAKIKSAKNRLTKILFYKFHHSLGKVFFLINLMLEFR